MKDISYVNYLYNLLDNKETEYTSNFKFNLYLTLLSLNNNYHNNIYHKELDIIEDYLRKVNNYKVKIQLKRKTVEIDKLYNEIKEKYEKNKHIIDKYNKENIDIIKALESREPKDITNIIDKLTKVKIKKVNDLNKYSELINKIINNIDKCNINDNIITIEDMTITSGDFYEIFDYLTDIDNYKEVYSNKDINNSRKVLINDIIMAINNYKNLNNNVLIPITLTYVMISNIPNYQNIATNKFKIDNIKISDLYSLANNTADNNKVMWRKITIPNEYLYSKIKEITLKGMYYFKDDSFIIDTNSDFKISISTTDMITFIKDNLKLLV